jgi:hypothetical protein
MGYLLHVSCFGNKAVVYQIKAIYFLDECPVFIEVANERL